MNYGLSQILLDQLQDQAVKHSLERLILFGSRARGDYKRTSDIDLAADGGNFDTFCLDIEEETSTLLNFDIVNLRGNIQEELLQSIRSEGIVLYEKIR